MSHLSALHQLGLAVHLSPEDVGVMLRISGPRLVYCSKLREARREGRWWVSVVGPRQGDKPSPLWQVPSSGPLTRFFSMHQWSMPQYWTRIDYVGTKSLWGGHTIMPDVADQWCQHEGRTQALKGKESRIPALSPVSAGWTWTKHTLFSVFSSVKQGEHCPQSCWVHPETLVLNSGRFHQASTCGKAVLHTLL